MFLGALNHRAMRGDIKRSLKDSSRPMLLQTPPVCSFFPGVTHHSSPWYPQHNSLSKYMSFSRTERQNADSSSEALRLLWSYSTCTGAGSAVGTRLPGPIAVTWAAPGPARFQAPFGEKNSLGNGRRHVLTLPLVSTRPGCLASLHLPVLCAVRVGIE